MKITQFEDTGNWTGKYGTMYTALVTLDDGTTGEVNMKSPGAWAIGDEVEVTENRPGKYGSKLKLRKPGADGQYTPSATRANSPDVQHRIDASWAIGQAVAFGVKDLDHVMATAEQFITMRNKLIERIVEKETK